jgi:Helicase conserved C-terminal domain/SNF2-related domain
MATKYHPKTKPFPHQALATLRAVRHRNYALFMEPRLGKTKAALDYIGMWQTIHRTQLRVLVVCPIFAIDVWAAEIKKHYPYGYYCETVDEEWERDGDPYTAFFFINREKIARRYKSKEEDYVYPYVEEIEAFKPDLLIVDESHLFKRAGEVAAQVLWRMVRRQRKRRSDGRPWVLLLTGTPNPKGWIDIFAQFRIMDQSVFGTNKAGFEEDYVTYGFGARKYTIVKYRSTKKLLRKVRDHSYSVTAAQVGMAGKQFTQALWATLPPPVRLAYNEMAEEFITEVEGESISAANQGVKRLRLLQIAGGFTTAGSQIHGAKVALLKGYLESLRDQGEHVIIYGRFSPEVDACVQTARSVGYHTMGVEGKTKLADRRTAIETLQRSKKPVALVFQVQVGALAIELARAAEVVFYSLPDSWDLYYQARQRVLGPNQKRPVRYTHILAHRTVDKSVLEGLAKKEDWHGTLMKDPRRYLYGGENGIAE